MQPDGVDCGRLLREVDWTRSPLGPVHNWGAELRTLVGVMLGSPQPMLIVWGPEQTTLYNDGYAVMCGNRHPQAFGQSFRDLWFDIWDQVEPIITAAYEGRGTSMDDIEFIMHRHGYPEETHFSFSYTPVRDAGGSVVGMFCACAETTGEVLARREKLSQRERLLQVFELSPGGIAILNGPDHVFEFANESYYGMIGIGREIIGKSVAEAVSEVVRQGFIELLDAVYRTGKPYVARGLAIELNRGPGGARQDRFIDLVYQPIRDASGVITGILVQAQDVTERQVEERHRQLISHELGHRLKNQLAMVQAIASQTLRTSNDLSTARRNLAERISVLSHAHDTIIKGGIGVSTVREIVAQMLRLHDDPDRTRFAVSGPSLRIGSKPSLSLSLILHELATNSLKYGALSVPDGKVSIGWSIVETDAAFVELTWKEQDGPPVTRPDAEGSGARLIRAGLNGTQGHVELTYPPDGLRFNVTADLLGFQQEH